MRVASSDAKLAWSYVGATPSDPNSPPAEPADPAPNSLVIEARYPGAMGNQMLVTLGFKVGPDLGTTKPAFQPTDVLAGFKEDGTFDWLVPNPSNLSQLATTTDGATYTAATLSSYKRVSVVVIDVSVDAAGSSGRSQRLFGQADCGINPDHPSALTTIFAAVPPDRRTELYVPLAMTYSGNWYLALFGTDTRATAALTAGYQTNATSPQWTAPVYVQLSQGSDGARPADYSGDQGSAGALGKSGLASLEDLQDISIVCAPGSTFGYLKNATWAPNALNIQGQLLTHCESMKYRVAVLDSPDGAITGDMVSYRQVLPASAYGALYYPWVTIMDPVSGAELAIPPSGLLAGIYARSDAHYGVAKAPANEPVNLAIGLETLVNKAQQELLNPQGINCIRFFPGRGYLVWGARTIALISAMSASSQWMPPVLNFAFPPRTSIAVLTGMQEYTIGAAAAARSLYHAASEK
jgi:hypothetical protein